MSGVKTTLSTAEIFKTREAEKYFPSQIEVGMELNNQIADLDVIIAGFNFPELTNAVITNYLKLEKKLRLQLYIVETSGDPGVMNKIIKGPQINHIWLTREIEIKPKKWRGSLGMALSATLGGKVSRSPLIFYSHSDMLAYKTNFLSTLVEALTPTIRLASFTQRHIIPFTGCMLIKREVIDNRHISWLLKETNPYLAKLPWLASLFQAHPESQLKHAGWIDCGEELIYHELVKGYGVYVGASRGGSSDYWKSPFAYFNMDASAFYNLLNCAENGIDYFPVKLTRQEFETKYRKVIQASEPKFWDFSSHKEAKNRRYWRYCFDDAGELCFIHHGRGTTTHEVNRWLKFSLQV